MSKQTSTDIPAVEEKRDARPWLPEERQKFYECFAKHYKKFNIISEMVDCLEEFCNCIDSYTFIYSGSSVFLP